MDDFTSHNYAILLLKKELKFEQGKLLTPVKTWEIEMRLRIEKKIRHYEDAIEAIEQDLKNAN